MAIRLNSPTKLRLRSGKVALTAPQATTTVGAAPPPATVGVAGTGVTLTSVATGFIYQRVGTSKAIPVTGTYTGTPSLIEARHVPDGTPLSSTAFPWVSLAANPTGGTFAGTINVPQGGWYNLQVRDGANTSLVAGSDAKIGVGVRVALLGQSNMVNLWAAVLNYPLADQLTRQYKNGVWNFTGNVDLTNSKPPGTTFGGSGYSSFTSVSPNGDGLVYFVNQLRTILNVPVAVFEFAVSGSAISQWVQGGNLYTDFVNQTALVGSDFECVLYHQGETNANSAGASTYQVNLQNIRDGLIAHTGRTPSTFHFGQVVVGPGTEAWSPEGTLGPIRKAQLAFVNAATTPDIFLAASAADMDLNGDGIHYNTASQIRMGRRFAKAVLKRLGLGAYGSEGPKITSATRAGAVVTVNIAQSGGTLLRDGAGGTGTTLQGFRVFANGVAQTISSTSISGNTVVLTLSATPTGTITLDYAMANAPYTAFVAPASVLYDNDNVPGESLGLPLQPIALITVT